MSDPVPLQKTTTVSYASTLSTFITYQLQMLKNNTPETFKLWKQLYELETAYNKDKEVHDKPFGSAIRTLIQKLHKELMEYKDPKEEWVALYTY